MIRLTSCEPVREPGFSKSECLELAKAFKPGSPAGGIVCDRWNCGGQVDSDTSLSPRQRDTIVAALRAYAK